MPKVGLNTLTPAQDALVARVHELLKDAKPGEVVTLPPDLVLAMNDAARDVTLARRNKERLEWLHSRESGDVDGWEWGIFRVKWQQGKPLSVQHTLSDLSDLDAAIESSTATHGVPPVEAPSQEPIAQIRGGDVFWLLDEDKPLPEGAYLYTAAGVDAPANSPAVEKAITRFHKRLGELRAWHCGRGCPSGDVCEVVKFGKPGPCEGTYGVQGINNSSEIPNSSTGTAGVREDEGTSHE